MELTLARAARWIAIAAGGIAYSVLAHYSTDPAVAAARPSLGVAVSLAPALTLLLWLAWRAPWRRLMLLLGAGVGGLLWAFWGGLEHNFNWVYFLQHAGTYLMLAAVFGVTLGRGRQPLISRFAEAVRGHLTPEVARYTRQVTWAWLLFFLAIALTSAGLFFFAAIGVWSVFANFLTFPLILLMFVAEYGVRLRVLPQQQQGKHNILDGIRAYWKTPATPPDASSSSN